MLETYVPHRRWWLLLGLLVGPLASASGWATSAAHAVLLPDGFRFSKHTTRSDWTDELLTQIRAFYRQRVDQRKLDEYLNSVREIEQRIEQAGNQGELQGWRAALDKPNIQRPADGIPQNLADHMRLMCDILVLAFQTDATNLPVVLLGGGGGQIQGGRVLDYLDKPNRKMCSLYLSLLDKYRIPLDKFGDSNERLAEV
ncbi:MAG: DUF1552 domain-containing protein [Planctomycetaceae bacterium]